MAKHTQYTLNKLGLRASALAVASALTFAGLPLSAQAAGLGKVNVFSALGQPLRAEIEVSATREELAGMRAQLATPEAFRQAGLDFPMTLLSIKFAIDKRKDGQAVIRLSSDKPVNDPFVDMLLELNWSSGRLVREYTFLLDPPEIAAKAAVPVSSAVSKAAAPARQAVEVRASSPLDDKLLAPPPASAPPQPQKTQAADASSESTGKERAAGGEHQVKAGETLRKIANENKPEGVSLEQMLVGIFRANREAFDGNNMNRLKSGKILSIPEKEALASVTDAEAKKIIVTQSSDWNAYRRKLAGVAAQTPVSEQPGKQESSGKISAKVEEKVAPAERNKDRVRVSASEAAAAKAGAAAKRAEEDLIAKEKALKEANARLAMLEKNVSELQKLVELKNRSLAELQKQAAAKTPASEAKRPETPPAPAPVAAAEPAKPAPAPVTAPVESKPPAPPVKAEEPKAETKPEPKVEPKPEPAPEPKPEVKPEPKPEPKPEVKPEPKPEQKPVAPPPPPPPTAEEPGFLDTLFDNPLALVGGGGLLALLAGFLYKRRREEKIEAPLDQASTLSQSGSSLTANSIFRSTGGQSVDTSHTPAQTDFSQAGPGSIDTDEVDPVAEADVYMAYGRDAQAEEILLEARQKDPRRFAIHLKLLEIYANRKDGQQFETLASDLYTETGGVGADWEKAAAMGVRLDPQNPLYGGGVMAAPKAFDADTTVIVSPDSLKSTVTMPGQMAQMAAAASAAQGAEIDTTRLDSPVVLASAPAAQDLMSLDFDLGMQAEAAPAAVAPVERVASQPLPAEKDAVLDFDIGTATLPLPAASKPAPAKMPELEDVPVIDFDLPLDLAAPVPGQKQAGSDLDFDLNLDAMGSQPAVTASPADSHENEMLDIASIDESALEFDVQLTESTVLGQVMQAPSFDMDSISLDLDAPAPNVASSTPAPAARADAAEFSTRQADTVVNEQFGAAEMSADFDISTSDEVATKLDLAKAYEEMGDLEGARELLQEVLNEGDSAQKEKAQAVLARIG